MKKLTSFTITVLLFMVSAAPLNAQPLQNIRVADNHRYFVQVDGTPFFWLGDTAWSIFNQASPEQVDQYLADRAGKGFNVVQGCLVLWNGLRRPNPDGELPFIDRDPSQINDAFFKNVDAIIEKAERHGLYMAILPVWIKGYIRDTDRYGATLLHPERMRSYCKFLGQRYGHRPIFWVLGGDWPGRDTRQLSDAMAAGLIEGAGTDEILITYHPTGRQSSSFWFHDSDWLDFNIIQSGHFIETTNFRLVADDYAKRPVKPTLDSEPAYENISDRLIRDDPNARRIQAEDVRRSAYLAVFAGAAGHTYGCGEVYEFWDETQGRPMPGWGAQLPFEKSLNLPGASQMQHLRRLIESRPMLKRIPDQSLILSENSGRATRRIQACRAADGSYAFIYLPGDQTVEIDLGKLSGATLTAYWYDTRTGGATRLGDFGKTASRKFTPPDASVSGWVLVLDDATLQFPPPGQSKTRDRLFECERPLIGADISWVPSQEDRGTTFKDQGVEKDVLEILAGHKFNWIRLRLFVDPTATNGYSRQGYCGLEQTLAMAKRIEAEGMKFLLDFHYSDTWADPGKQFTPASWQGLSDDALADKMHEYTGDVLKRFIAEGVAPEMVQIGNEIHNGFVWPQGKLPKSSRTFGTLLRRASEAVRDADPKIKIMVHPALGGDNKRSVAFCDLVLSHNVVFDVIGQSYYPEHHGTLDELRNNLTDLVARYRKPIVVVEYKEHRKEVNDIVRDLPDGLGWGTFIWEATSSRWGGLFDRNGATTERIDIYPEFFESVAAARKQKDEGSLP